MSLEDVNESELSSLCCPCPKCTFQFFPDGHLEQAKEPEARPQSHQHA